MASPVVSSAVDDDGNRAESGIGISQPEPAQSDRAEGDIRPTLEGEPERHFESSMRVVLPGVVQDARFVWEGPDGDAQLRQSPHVVHGPPSLIRRSTTRYIVRPKLLPLASGDLMCVWAEADWTPLYQDLSDVLTVERQKIFFSICSSETGDWSEAAQVTAVEDLIGAGGDRLTSPQWDGSTIAVHDDPAIIAGLDLVQHVDTGEVHLLVLLQSQRQVTVPSGDYNPQLSRRRSLVVLSSEDDGGSWVERSRSHFGGRRPEISLLRNDAYDTSALNAIAAEVLPSGRVVAVLLTLEKTWSLVSDDRGATWTAYWVSGTDSNPLQGHGIGSSLARNGVAMFVMGFRKSSTFPNAGQQSDDWGTHLIMTADGEAYSSRQYVATDIQTVDPAICVGPEGWPHVYGTAHAFLERRADDQYGVGRTEQFQGAPGDLSPQLPSMADNSVSISPDAGGSLVILPNMASGSRINLRGEVEPVSTTYRGQINLQGRSTALHAYQGWFIQISEGTGEGQAYRINGYRPSGTVYVSHNWNGGGNFFNPLTREWQAYVALDDTSKWNLLTPRGLNALNFVQFELKHDDDRDDRDYRGHRIRFIGGAGELQQDYQITDFEKVNRVEVIGSAAVSAGTIDSIVVSVDGGDWEDLYDDDRSLFLQGVLGDVGFGEVFLGVAVQDDDADRTLRDLINSKAGDTGVYAKLDANNAIILYAPDATSLQVLVGEDAEAVLGLPALSKVEEPAQHHLIEIEIPLEDDQPDETTSYILHRWTESEMGDLYLTSEDTAVVKHDAASASIDLANWYLRITSGPGVGDEYQVASSRAVVAADLEAGGDLNFPAGGPATHVSVGDILIDISPNVWSDDLTGGLAFFNHERSLFPARKSAFRLTDDKEGCRDWLWGRRFSSRDPSLSWAEPSDFMPVPSQDLDNDESLSVDDQAALAPFAFHIPVSSRERNGFAAATAPAGDYSAEEWERVAHNGFVGIDAVHWRGRVVLATVFQQDSEGAIAEEDVGGTTEFLAQTAGEILTLEAATGDTVEADQRIAWVGSFEHKTTVGGVLTIADNPADDAEWEVGDSIANGESFFTVTSVADPVDARPDLAFSSLMAYQVNGWQSLRERLPSASPHTTYGRPVRYPAFPAGGHIYNHTWDCYAVPTDVGWSKVGFSEDIAIEADEGGRLRLASGVKTYFDAPLDNATDLGGDPYRQQTTPEFCIRAVLRLADDAPTTAPVGLRVLSNVGSGDVAGVAASLLVTKTLGGTFFSITDHEADESFTGAEVPEGDWLEVLFAGRYVDGSTTVYAFARGWTDDQPGDWIDALGDIAPEDRVLSDTTIALSPYIRFGNLTDESITSYWKSVHVSRGWSLEHPVPLEIPALSDPDEETGSSPAPTGTGEAEIDSGIDNYMRASRTTYSPAQFVRDDVRARWRGQAVTPGGFSLGVGHRFGAENVLSLPTLRQWRSPVIDNSEPSRFHLLYDSGDTGFRPEAIAMFGRNFPSCRIGFGNDTDADDILIHLVAHGVTYGGSNLVRTTAYWSYAPAGLALITGTPWRLEVDGNRLTVFEDGSPRSIWVPHQFSSQATGRSFYIAFVRDSEAPYDNTPAPFDDDAEGPYTSVFKILDNTESTLVLDGEPGTVYRVGGEDRSFQIFSDCQVVECAEAFSGVDPEVSYRYMKLTIGRAQMNSDDGQFRLGHLMLGRVFDLDDPHPEWGWSLSYASGSDVADRPDGARFANRKGPMSRELSMGFAVLRPPNGTVDRLLSRGRRGHKDWTSLIRRLEVDKTPVVVAFDPSEPGSNSGASVSGPEGMMLARVTDPGTLEHVAYDCAESIARYIARIRGIVLREEF